MRKHSFFLLLLTVVLVSSCQRDVLYSESQALADARWSIAQPLNFDVDVVDTSAAYDVYVTLRHNTDYEWMNVFLFLKTYYPNHDVSRDTVECYLADASGRWMGDGNMRLKSYTFLLKPGVVFPMMGSYRFEFVQGMRQDPLLNIEDLGIKICRSKQQNP